MEIQSSFVLQRNSLHAWSINEKRLMGYLNNPWKSEFLLWFLIAVNTNLKPFKSVPQPSARYLSVKKLLIVIILPTLCIVLRQDISNCINVFNPKVSWQILEKNYQMHQDEILNTNKKKVVLLLVLQKHGHHHKWIIDHCNPNAMNRNELKIVVELNGFEM